MKTDRWMGEVLYPGEIEARTRRERANGIHLPDATWSEITACAEGLGLEAPIPQPLPPK